MEEALMAKLLATAGVTAIFGTRIRWGERGQGDALPTLVLNVVSGEEHYTHGGAGQIGMTRIQFDSYGATSKQSNDGSAAVLTALSGASFTQGSVTFGGIFFDSKFGPRAEGESPKVFRTMRDARVWVQ